MTLMRESVAVVSRFAEADESMMCEWKGLMRAKYSWSGWLNLGG